MSGIIGLECMDIIQIGLGCAKSVLIKITSDGSWCALLGVLKILYIDSYKLC